MTIEELRTRKRELQARLKHERELQAKGEGKELDLFILREELNDVNDHLRALTAGRRHRGGLTSIPEYRLEEKSRQQYLNWRREDTALDDEIDDGHARMRRAAVNGLDKLSSRQREMLEMYLAGKNMPTIAAELGLNRSTVSRNIRRAKKNLRDETERAMTEHRLLADSLTVDLREPAAAKAVLLTLTPMQAGYFYLYYSECLQMPEIAALTGKNRSTVSRTCRRALWHIGVMLGGQEVVLEHPEALDELAYQVYCQLGTHPELLAEALSVSAPCLKYRKQGPRPSREPPLTGRISVQVRQTRRREAETGKLLSALLEQQAMEDYPQIHRWLEAIFAVLLDGLEKRGAKVPRSNARQITTI